MSALGLLLGIVNCMECPIQSGTCKARDSYAYSELHLFEGIITPEEDKQKLDDAFDRMNKLVGACPLLKLIASMEAS